MNKLDLAQFQTEEDQAINRALAKRMGTWKWGDRYQPSYRYRVAEFALGMTGARVGFASASRVLCQPVGAKG